MQSDSVVAIRHNETMCVQVRALAKRAKAGKYRNKVTAQEQRRDHLQQHPIPLNEFANVFR